MFITQDRVKKITGYENITTEDIYIAQMIVETYAGRSEAKIDDADDFEILAKATAYQAVYLKADPNNVFEQIAVQSIVQDSSVISFKAGDENSPWVAPLAVMACKQLSWKRSRSIRMGKINLPTRKRGFWSE